MWPRQPFPSFGTLTNHSCRLGKVGDRKSASRSAQEPLVHQALRAASSNDCNATERILAVQTGFLRCPAAWQPVLARPSEEERREEEKTGQLTLGHFSIISLAFHLPLQSQYISNHVGRLEQVILCLQNLVVRVTSARFEKVEQGEDEVSVEVGKEVGSQVG